MRAVVGSEEYAFSIIALEPLEAVCVQSCGLKEFCLEHSEGGKDLTERLAGSISSRWQTTYTRVSSRLT